MQVLRGQAALWEPAPWLPGLSATAGLVDEAWLALLLLQRFVRRATVCTALPRAEGLSTLRSSPPFSTPCQTNCCTNHLGRNPALRPPFQEDRAWELGSGSPSLMLNSTL